MPKPPILAETHPTAAGPIPQHMLCAIAFRCDTPGPEVDRGFVRGYWNGDVDRWGKLTIVTEAATLYLFPHEFVSIAWE